MLEIILLSITQGITEFLPISSSAHLILVSKFTNFNNENLTLDISLHLGSLIAVILFFISDILNFIQNKSLFLKIILGSLPAMIVGYLLVRFNIIDYFRNTYVIGITTILFGILLYFSDKSKTNKKISSDLTIKKCLYIGLLQALAFIPGISRSGITITAARFLKFDRIESTKISFLLSIPILSATSFYGFLKIIEAKNLEVTTQNFWAMFLSFVFSFVTLKFFIKFLKKFTLTFFMIYRIILGIVIFFYINDIQF